MAARTDRGDVRRNILLVNVAHYEARLSNSAVPENEQLERVIKLARHGVSVDLGAKHAKSVPLC